MKKLIAVALLFATPALAQDVSLKVNSDEINIMGKALGRLPYDEVAPLIQKLRQQIAEQQQPKQVEVPKADAPKGDGK